MKLSKLRGCVLLSTSMLCAPSLAFAQDPAPTDFAVTDEIIVLGRNIPNPQRSTSQIASFLSEADLERTGDSNAALALTRLSGLSVVGGKFAFVRGLGDRYSTARLNGSPLPSPEPLRRTVPLNLFPSNILSGATVQKTFSTNYPGEFGGGIIDLTTVNEQVEPYLKLKAGIGLNTVSSVKDGIYVNGGDLDWLGYDDGIRDFPGGLQAAIDSGTLIESLSPAEIETIGESLINSPLSVIQRGTVGPDFNGSIDGGWSKDLDNGMTVALIGVAGYSSDWFTKRALRETQNGAIVGNDLDRNETALTSTVNGLVTTALSWEENTVSLTGLYIHSTRKESQIDEGFSFTAPGDGSIFTESNNALEQDLLMGQLAGEHTFGDFDIDWRGAYARSTRDDPYNQSFTREVRDGEVFFDPGRAVNRRDISWSELEDDNYSAGVDITWNLPFLSGPRTGAVSAGYEYVESERAFVNYGYFFRNPFTLSDEASGARVDFLYSPDNIGPSGFRLTDAVNPGGDAYTADLTVHGAYFEADLELIPTVRMTAGVRFEDGDQNVVNSDRFGDSTGFTPSRIQNEYWLPSAAITWNFVDNMQLRGSYSHTIGRPQFRELAGSQFSDPENDRLFRGNPFLIDSEFRNYDARYEYYLGSNQFITLAGFYKQIDNPIEEYTFQTSTGNFNSTFINAPEAELYGAEFEYRTRFGMSFTDWFDRRDWLFSVNYTFTESEVNASTGDEIITFSGTPDDAAFLDGAPLVGTPKHIVNAQFGWEDEDDQLTILLGWVDERIIQRGGLLGAAGQIPDVIEKPGVQLDVNFRHDVNVLGTDFTIGLSARNLLGTRHQEFQISDAVGRTDFNTYERGRDLSASLTAKF